MGGASNLKLIFPYQLIPSHFIRIMNWLFAKYLGSDFKKKCKGGSGK